jgi:hypothetical protein
MIVKFRNISTGVEFDAVEGSTAAANYRANADVEEIKAEEKPAPAAKAPAKTTKPEAK